MKLIILAMFLVGCAGNQTKSIDLKNIDNKDFKTVKQVRYKSSSDYNKKINSPLSDVTNNESIHRALLFDGEVNDTNIYSQISTLCKNKEFKKAFEIVKNNARAYSKNPSLWNLTGSCYLLKKERRLSLLFLNKALDINSRYAPAYNNLGVMYLLEKDYPRAQVAFEKAINISTYAKTPRVNLASLFLEFGLYGQARSLLLPIYKKKIKDVEVLTMIGTSYLMEQDLTRAEKYFKQIESDQLERAEVGINLSLLYLGLKKPNKAEDVIDDVELNNRDWKRYYNKVRKKVGEK